MLVLLGANFHELRRFRVTMVRAIANPSYTLMVSMHSIAVNEYRTIQIQTRDMVLLHGKLVVVGQYPTEFCQSIPMLLTF